MSALAVSLQKSDDCIPTNGSRNSPIYAEIRKKRPQHLGAPLPNRNRSSLLLAMSSRKTNSFSISLHPIEYVHVPIPIERRERKEVTSFSIPPSVKRRLNAYAKRAHMSSSDLVTLLCVNFLGTVMPAGAPPLETRKHIKEPSEPPGKP